MESLPTKKQKNDRKKLQDFKKSVILWIKQPRVCASNGVSIYLVDATVVQGVNTRLDAQIIFLYTFCDSHELNNSIFI